MELQQESHQPAKSLWGFKAGMGFGRGRLQWSSRGLSGVGYLVVKPTIKSSG